MSVKRTRPKFFNMIVSSGIVILENKINLISKFVGLDLAELKMK